MSILQVKKATNSGVSIPDVFIARGSKDIHNFSSLNGSYSLIELPKIRKDRTKFIKDWAKKNKLFSTILILPLTACGGEEIVPGSSGSSSSNAAGSSPSISGFVFDGYLQGTTVYLDLNSDGIQDANEPTGVTNSGGYFSFDIEAGDETAPVVAVAGGVDVDTGEVFRGTLTAPAGSSTVSPITTLVHEVMQSGSVTKAQAVSYIQSALSLSGVDLLNVDPFAGAGNADLAKATTLLGSLMQVGGDDSEADLILDTVTNKVLLQVTGSTISPTFDLRAELTDETWVGTTLTDAVPAMANIALAAQVYSQKATTIAQAASVEDLATLQSGSNVVFGPDGITLSEGFSLNISAEDADGQAISGSGTVAITGVETQQAADFSKISVSGVATATAADDLTFTGVLSPELTLVIEGAKVLTASATVLNGKSVSGDGQVIVTDLDQTLDADLSQITVTGSIQAVFSSSGTFTGNLGTVEMLVADGQTLTAGFSNLDGKTINHDGTEDNQSLVVEIDAATAAADLSQINSNLLDITSNIVETLTFSGNLQGASTSIADGVTMTIPGNLADGQLIGGTGNIIVTQLSQADSLLGITSTGTKTTNVDADLSFTGDFGTGFSINVAAAAELTLDASLATAQSITGDGSVQVINLQDTTLIDLSGITANSLSANISGTGDVVFQGASQFGSAAISVNNSGSSAFSTGVDFGTSSISVSAGSTLVLSTTQVQALSANGTIVGAAASGSEAAANVYVNTGDVLSSTAAETATATVKIEISGGVLTFDLPEDGDDVLILSADSSINLNGGTLVVDSGNLDVNLLTNSDQFAGIDNVIVNSGLTLSASQLEELTSAEGGLNVDTSGSGSLVVEVSSEADIEAVKEAMLKLTTTSELPAIGVEASDTAKGADDTVKASLDSALADAASEIAENAGVSVSVTQTDGGVILVAPGLKILDADDASGLYKLDGAGSAAPSFVVSLPNAPAPNSDAAITIYDSNGAEIVTALLSSLTTTDDAATGISTVTLVPATAISEADSGSYYATVSGVEINGSVAKSNNVKYVVDETPPEVTFSIADPTISIGESTAIKISLTEKVKGFTAEDITLSYTDDNDVVIAPLGQLTELNSFDGGQNWSAVFSPNIDTEGNLSLTIGAGAFTDLAGNTNSEATSNPIKIDTLAPAAPSKLKIRELVNATDADTGINFLGAKEAGATVSLTFGSGLTKQSEASDEGAEAWDIQLTKEEISGLGEGPEDVKITQTDAVGNKSLVAAKVKFNIDTTADENSDLQVVVSDKLINNLEKTAVAFNVNGLDNDATATVTFSQGVTVVQSTDRVVDLSNFNDGPISVSVSASDTAGNTATGTKPDSITLDTVAPTIEAVSTSWGSVINAADDDNDGTVTVTTNGAADGQTVTVALNRTDYTGTVSSDSVEITIPAADLQALTDGDTYNLTADVSDAAGNAAVQNDAISFAVDVTAPTIEAVSASWGNAVNAADEVSEGTVTVTTKGAEDGQTVTVALNGTDYTGDVSSGSAAITIPAADLQALTEGDTYNLTANVSDAAGNAAVQDSDTTSFAVDVTAPTIGTVSTSWGSVINAAEVGSDGTVTVTTVGAEDGQTVTVALNGTDYTGDVSGGSVAITIPAADLQALTDDSTYSLTANVSDAAGNAAAQNDTTSFAVDVTAPTIETVSASWGNAVNAADDDNDGTVTVTTKGAEDGQTVTVALNGTDYTGDVYKR